jgi:predicted Zn finger-like uncharacterized protein
MMALLTCCPDCRTVFRVSPAQLRAARGFVECGACEQVFNALDRLAEDLRGVAAPAPAPAVAAQDDLASLPLDAGDDGPRVDAIALDELVVGEAEPSMPRIELAQPDSAREPAVDDAPAILREDLARLAAHERRGGGFLWALAALLLIAALGAQGAWHWRAELLVRLPQLLPHATRLCVALGCRLEQAASIADIELVARDVREHPQYTGTLLVNATLLNRGHAPAAWPTIELGVFDRRGASVGVRRFAPREYLDRSIDIDTGMPSGRRVHVVLEIAGVGESADSFEFRFL